MHKAVPIPPTLRRVRRRRRALQIAAVLLAVLLLLTVGFTPAVPRREAPAADEVAAGRDAGIRLREALRDTPGNARVRYTNRDLDGIVALAGNVLHLRHAAAQVEGDKVAAALSLPIGPLWLNLHASAASHGPGFPAIWLRIGHLPIPPFMVRAGAELARGLLILRGVKLPPLDSAFKGVRVGDGAVDLVLDSPPGGSGIVRSVVGMQTAEADTRTVVLIYCVLQRRQAAEPSPEFATHLARAIEARPPGVASAPANRAALVALAMFAVNPRAGELAGTAFPDSVDCRKPVPDLNLVGRTDLPKHWALSAALGTMIGDDAGRAMGEWKELADSLPGGSGFSFVDLSADRAGLRIGRAAGDPASAERLARALSVAHGPDLLPPAALGGVEDLPNAEFVARYRSIEDARYAAAVARIDALLDALPLLRAP